MRKLVVTVVALAVLAPATALAGGWATVQLSSTPKGAKAGVPWQVSMTVLQHGVTPLEGIQPQVRISQGTLIRTFLARPTQTTGVYRARVVFPRAGMWKWSIWDGFSRTHTYKPVRVTPAAL
jgi:hypothetical protein